MTRIILGNAPINNGNRGCVALSITAIFLIDKLFKEVGESYEIYLPDSQEKNNGRVEYSARGVDTLFFINLEYVPDSLRTLAKGIIKPVSIFSSLKIFKSSDYIFDIGQGDSFSDIYGKKRFDAIDRIHKIARRFGKPYCILPQTIGPFKDEGVRRKAVKSLESASMVMARDKLSYDYVKEIAPNQKELDEYIDVAFFMPFEKMDFSEDYIHVGLNISALLWHGGYTRDNQFELIVDYQKTIRSIINYFLSLTNVQLHLIAHVVGSERGIENDYEVCYDLWREYGNSRLVLAPFALGPIEIKSYISGLDFFIGARMHATIGAFSSGVPVVPMAYSRKFNGLFYDTLDYHYMVDLKSDDQEEALSKIENSFKIRGELKDIIRDRMNGIVKVREKLLMENLKKFLNL